MTARPVFAHAEGEAIAVLEMLLGAQTVAAKRVAQHGPRAVELPERPRPELVRAAADRLNTGVLRHLVESGGWRSRRVLRRGKRREGRIFDAGVNDGFTLRFGPPSLTVWWGLSRALHEIVGPPESRAGARARRRHLRPIHPEGTTHTGDWIFFALADRALSKLSIDADAAGSIATSLRALSPLAALTALDGGPGLHRAAMDLLLAPGAVRIVECLDDELLRGWRAATERVLVSEHGVAGAIGAWTALSTALLRWLKALDESRRADLARPLLRYAVWLATDVFADTARVSSNVTTMAAVRSIADRSRVLESVATLAGVGIELIALRARLARERYGDERYEEAQLFLSDFDTLAAPHRPRLESLRAALGGAIG